MIEKIDVAKIDTAGRLRHVRPERAAAMAESIAEHGQLSPIKVIERADGGYRLVFGEHRLAAVRDHLKWPQITAEVIPETSFGDEADRQIEEIVENFVSFPLTVLEEAVALATWKDLYEARNNTAGRGGRRSRKTEAEQNENFSFCFSEAAAVTLGCSERKVQFTIKIARGIASEVRARIFDHRIADHQGELLALAAEPEARQAAIADILLAEDAEAESVAEAIAILDRLPKPRVAPAYEKLSERFAKLTPREQHAFFALHRDAIETWLAETR
ncbi:ParB/RepB/Spo0J family partition protein [Afifella pfennigii]|uniref:ParB/RepB/Spo0J family partition protein n=1 Tax=Afifella pfennigii TaxID=209897 RepID=UPI00047A187E|nr:ParB/RepB/Spo0J family partition protein [Afifella pfennigii]